MSGCIGKCGSFCCPMTCQITVNRVFTVSMVQVSTVASNEKDTGFAVAIGER